MRIRLTEVGTEYGTRALDGCSGLVEATPEYWIDGRQHRPLRRRHSGKGRAVPVRCPWSV